MVLFGTRLASHGFVVATTDHEGDPVYPWSVSDNNVLYDRPVIARSNPAPKVAFGAPYAPIFPFS